MPYLQIVSTTMPIQFSSIVAPAPDVLIRTVGEESVVLNLQTEQYLGLDDVSTRIWQLLTAGGSIQSTYETLLTGYEVDPEQLRRDLDDFVRELLQLQLVELKNTG